MTASRTLTTLACCAALLFLTACSSKEDRLQSGLVKGADFVRLADWDKASVEVRNVLQIDPKNAQAYFIAGQVAEGKSEIQRAFTSYNKAVELKPDHFEAKVGVARIYLLANDPTKSAQLIDEVLAASPKHVGARTIKAALAARSGDVAGAVAQAKALIGEQKAAPVDASMLLAGLYANQNDAAGALATIEAALQADPKHLGLLRVAAQIVGAASEPAMQSKTVAFYRRATEQAPKNIELWNVWALHHVRKKELDLAEAVLRASIKAQPDDSQRHLALLSFVTSQRGFEPAEKAFLAAIKDKPKDMSLRFGLVNLYRGADRAPDARRVLQEIVDANKEAPGLSARTQLAADHLASGKVEAARALIAEVLVASPRDNAALLMRGRMLLAAGDARSAIIDLRAVARDQPGSTEVAGLLAQAHRRAGEPQLAREVLSDAVKFKPDSPELRLLLAADLADAKDFKAATAEVDNAIKAAPQNLRAYDFKAQLAVAQKDLVSAEKVFVSYKTQFPKEPSGFVRLGQFYAEQKKFDAALKEYDAASRLAPQAFGPALSAIGLLMAQRKFDEADARVDAMLKADPKQLLAHQLRGEVAMARGDDAAAEKAHRDFIALAPTAATGYLSLARLTLKRSNLADALLVLDQGEKAAPTDLSLPAARAEWLARGERADEAIAVYESLLKRAPDDDAFANNLAYLLVERKGDKPSLERALTLAQRFKASANPGYLDTLGWSHYKLGQYAEAAATLERAVALAPTSALLQLHLGLALHKQGNTAKAQEWLKKALASKAALPNLDEARQIVALR